MIILLEKILYLEKINYKKRILIMLGKHYIINLHKKTNVTAIKRSKWLKKIYRKKS